ncbi:hypothetical protein NDU88_000554 [Pleurodeles waltl]|uniref:Uncharacterized protein n=1 Tax=Pleurodeles waltl TaxID=8319 RepID=A0AAV7R923_PLEWA|nr:hypothetical protein NDU88_000554 [Pleurodeles waltl]
MCYTLHDTLLPAYPQQSHPGHVLHITRHPAASVPSADTLRPAYPQQSHPGHVLHITRHPVASLPSAVTPRACAAHFTTPCGQRTLSSHTQGMCCTLHDTLRQHTLSSHTQGMCCTSHDALQPACPQQSHPGHVLHITRHHAAIVPSAVTPRACAAHFTTPCGQHTPSSHTQALCCTLHDTLRPAYPQQSHPGHVLNITQHPAASIPPAVTPRACAAQCCQCTLTSHNQGMCCTLHDTLRPAYPEQSQPGPVVHITQHPAASVPSAVTPRACAAHYTTPCGQRTLSSHTQGMCCTLHDTLRPAYPQQSHTGHVLHITRHPAASVPPAVTPRACAAHYTTPCGQHTLSSHTQGMCYTLHDTLLPAYPQQSHPGHVLHITRHPAASVPSADTLRPAYPQQSHPGHVLHITRHPVASLPSAVTPRACAAHFTTPCGQRTLSSHTQGMCCTLHDTLRQHTLSSHTQGMCCTSHDALQPACPQQSHPGHVLHITRHHAAIVPSAVTPRACAAHVTTPCGQRTLSRHPAASVPSAVTPRACAEHTRHPAAIIPSAVTPRACAAHHTTPCGQHTLSSHTQGMCCTLHETLQPAFPQQSHQGMCCTLHDTLRPAYPQQSHPRHVLHVTRHPAASVPSAVAPRACAARYTTPCGQYTLSSHTQGMGCTLHGTLQPAYPQQSHPGHVLHITRHAAASVPSAVTPRAYAAHYTAPCGQLTLSSHTQGLCCTLHDAHPGHVLHITRHPAASVPSAITPRACAEHYTTPCGQRTLSSHSQGLCCTLHNTLRPAYPQQSHPGHVLHITQHPGASVPPAVTPRACAAHYTTPCGQCTLSSHNQGLCCTLHNTLRPAYPQQSHPGHVLHITRHPAASVPSAVTPRACAAHYTTPCGHQTLSSHTQGMCCTLHDTLRPAYPQQSHPGHVLHITRHPVASVPSAVTPRACAAHHTTPCSQRTPSSRTQGMC